MKYIRRTIGFEIVIKSSINSPETGVNFSSDIGYGYNSNLLSYSYTESMHNIQGSFSLSATYSEDLDMIQIHDVVEIKEGESINRKTMFIGLIKNISYGQKMNDNGQVTSVVNITGTNIFGIISDTKLVIDRAIIGNLCQNDAATKFQDVLSEAVDKDKLLGNTINAIIEAFTTLKTENQQNSTYYNGIISSIKVQAGKLPAKYPMALGYLGGQQCTLWQLISQVVPPPIYECFLTLDSNAKKYNLVVRECPFMAEKTQLTANELDDLYLKGSDLHKKDNEVYSYYLTTIAGSGLNKNIIMLVNDGQGDAGDTSQQNNADKQQNNVACLDKDLMSRFGFRPLIVECGFFDNTQPQETASQVSKDISTALAQANKNNHEKLSGTIEALHDGKIWHVGTVIKSHGKEFYIEQIETRWNYGQAHTRKFFVTRGGNTVNTAN